MKCKDCGSSLPEPTVVGDLRWYVCADCGQALALPAKSPTSASGQMALFAQRFGHVLPADYPRYAGREADWAFPLPDNDAWARREYPDGHYTPGQFAALDPHAEDSVFESEALRHEWGLPEGLVLFEGDGHHWLALDYRDAGPAARVILIDSDTLAEVEVAPSFAEFVARLRPYESVYDADGNLRSKQAGHDGQTPFEPL